MLTQFRTQPFIFLIFLIFLASKSSIAISKDTPAYNTTKKKPTCEAKTVTRNCEFFKERANQISISLPDGGVLLNPLYVLKTTLETGSPQRIFNNGNINNKYNPIDYDKILYNHAEIMDSLEDSGFSTRFKIAYTETAVAMAMSPNMRFEMPWPPDEKDGPKKAVNLDEVEAYLKENLNENDYSQLQALVKAQAGPLQAQLELQQKAKQKEMELQKKQQEDTNRNIATYNRKKDRVKELFKYSQENIIATIQRGKKDAELTAEEKALIKKIKTIQLNDLDNPTVAASSFCSGGHANAFYNSTHHNINVCPGMIRSSDTFIVTLMSHELAHAIDPCTSTMPLWEINTDKLKAFLNDPKLKEEDKSEILERISPETKFINYDLNLSINNEDIQKRLVASGVITKNVEGVPLSNYPFNKEYKCLVDESNIRENSAKDIAFTKEYLKKHNRDLKKKSIDRKAINRYFSGMDKHPQCIKGITPRSQIGETMSDMFGALIEEKYILENPLKSEDEKVAALLWIENTCKKNFDDNKAQNISPQNLASVLSSQSFNDSHLSHEDRISKIFLNLPGTAREYDCTRTVPRCFDHLSFSKRMNTGKTQGSTADQKAKGIK